MPVNLRSGTTSRQTPTCQCLGLCRSDRPITRSDRPGTSPVTGSARHPKIIIYQETLAIAQDHSFPHPLGAKGIGDTSCYFDTGVVKKPIMYSNDSIWSAFPHIPNEVGGPQPRRVNRGDECVDMSWWTRMFITRDEYSVFDQVSSILRTGNGRMNLSVTIAAHLDLHGSDREPRTSNCFTQQFAAGRAPKVSDQITRHPYRNLMTQRIPEDRVVRVVKVPVGDKHSAHAAE